MKRLLTTSIIACIALSACSLQYRSAMTPPLPTPLNTLNATELAVVVEQQTAVAVEQTQAGAPTLPAIQSATPQTAPTQSPAPTKSPTPVPTSTATFTAVPQGAATATQVPITIAVATSTPVQSGPTNTPESPTSTPVTPTDPPPASGGSPTGANLLVNPGFEGGFWDYGLRTNSWVPNGWSMWAILTEEGCYRFPPNVYDMFDPNHVYEGGHAQIFEIAFQSFEAGLMQQVPVTPGKTYRFTIHAKARAFDNSPIVVAVGIDPLGGTDPFAATSVWTNIDKVNENPALGFPGVYTPISITATAQNSTITVYTFGWARWCVGRNEVYYDAASLYEVAP